MARRIRESSIVAGLAMLGATLAGGREAQAAGTLPAAITISGGLVQGPGDPLDIYEFGVDLVNGSISYSGTGPATAFFTIHGLVGVTPSLFPTSTDLGSMTTEPTIAPAVVWSPGINLTIATAPYASDITWSYMGSSVLSTPDTLSLGIFTIETSQSFPKGQPPVPYGSTISYSYTINDNSGNSLSGSGTFLLQQGSIPEPSSVILLLAGGGGLPLLIVRERRRRRLRSRRATGTAPAQPTNARA
jgi:hypothetical protein